MVKLNINGVEVGNDELIFLPERGILPDTENTLTQVGGSNGSVFLQSRLKERIIPIKFVVKTMNRRDFEISMSAILYSKEPVPLTFDDKPDEVWYGLVDGGIDLDRAYTIGKGTINWIVPDGYAHSTKIKTATNNGTTDTITFTNNGTDSTPITVTAKMKSDNGFLGLALNGRAYQVGNPTEVDGTHYDKSETLVPGDPMPNPSTGELNKAGFEVIPPTQGKLKQGGSVKLDSGDGNLLPNGFGDTSYKGPHGPSITYALPADSFGNKGSKNFEFRWHAGFGNFLNDYGKVGQLAATIHDKDGKAMCSIAYNDLTQQKTEFVVRYDINGKQYYENNIRELPDGFTGHAYVIKSGAQFTFCWNYLKPVTFICDELKNTEAYYVSFSFMQWQDVAVPPYFGIVNWNFRKSMTDLFLDTPNYFKKGDVVVLNSERNELTINGFADWDRVDIGSRPLLANVGDNTLGIVMSEWATMPEVTVNYQERWL